MNILMITGTFPPRNFGGVTAVSYTFAKKLTEKGHMVTVYTTDAGNTWSSRLDVMGTEIRDRIKIYYFKNISNSFAFRNRIFLPIGSATAIKKNIRNFDIVHLHEYRSLMCIFLHYYAKKNGVPYILQAHGSVLPIFQKQQLKRIFDSLFGYKILKDASRVIALTKTEAEQYIKMGVDEDKIQLVPNGVNLSEYEIMPKKGEFKRKFGLKNDEKIILYAGRLHVSKGIDLLIEAFADISSDLDNTKLVLLGPDDGFRLSLDSLIQKLDLNDKVIFTGFVDSYEKKMAFVDASVFVTPQFSGFPVTFLESCACGTPIITTNNGDELDWINNNVGYVVEYDKDRLRDAITYILKNEDVRERFGEKGKLLVRDRFDWDKIVNNLEVIYEKCTSG